MRSFSSSSQMSFTVTINDDDHGDHGDHSDNMEDDDGDDDNCANM